MIPLKNMMARRSVPVVTILLIVANVLVFCYQLSLSRMRLTTLSSEPSAWFR
jgi:membrane associated rhomboid family serine protease